MEEWKKIKGHENYEVSNLGNVRNKKQQILKPRPSTNGYTRIMLKRKDYYVHRLVMDTFSPINKKTEVNHINFNRQDNRLANLEWNTRSENRQHSILSGRHNTVKTNEHDVREIRAKRKQGLKIKEIATKYGLPEQVIKRIVYKKTWSWID